MQCASGPRIERASRARHERPLDGHSTVPHPRLVGRLRGLRGGPARGRAQPRGTRGVVLGSRLRRACRLHAPHAPWACMRQPPARPLHDQARARRSRASLQGCLMHEVRHARVRRASKAFSRCAIRRCSGSGGRSAQQARSHAEAPRFAGTSLARVWRLHRRHMQPRAGWRHAPAARWRPASARVPARLARRASAPPGRPARCAARLARPHPPRRLRPWPARGSPNLLKNSRGSVCSQRCSRERGPCRTCHKCAARPSASCIWASG